MLRQKNLTWVKPLIGRCYANGYYPDLTPILLATLIATLFAFRFPPPLDPWSKYFIQAELIIHPVMQRLLRIKWNLFGKRGAIKMFALNFLYTLNWTVLGLLVPGM